MRYVNKAAMNSKSVNNTGGTTLDWHFLFTG